MKQDPPTGKAVAPPLPSPLGSRLYIRNCLPKPGLMGCGAQTKPCPQQLGLQEPPSALGSPPEGPATSTHRPPDERGALTPKLGPSPTSSPTPQPSAPTASLSATPAYIVTAWHALDARC